LRRPCFRDQPFKSTFFCCLTRLGLGWRVSGLVQQSAETGTLFVLLTCLDLTGALEDTSVLFGQLVLWQTFTTENLCPIKSLLILL
jgi:hypothetical protein